jgi:hypothetical protein
VLIEETEGQQRMAERAASPYRCRDHRHFGYFLARGAGLESSLRMNIKAICTLGRERDSK